jgi:hypothetical protein
VSERVVEVVQKTGMWRVVEGAFILSSHRDREDALTAGRRRAAGGRARLVVRWPDGSVDEVLSDAPADDQAPSAS